MIIDFIIDLIKTEMFRCLKSVPYEVIGQPILLECHVGYC